MSMHDGDTAITKPEFIVAEDGSATIFHFLPRSNTGLSSALAATASKKCFYFQRPLEQFNVGQKYSLILYSDRIQFFLRQLKLPLDYEITYGMNDLVSSQSLELAEQLNENQVIFPNSMTSTHHKNSKLVNQGGLAVNIYFKSQLVGHTSVVRLGDRSLKTKDGHYILMRFLVHQEHRQSGGIKEALIREISKFIPQDTSLSLQVFPNNEKAQRFFTRRMNVVPFLEKWVTNENA